MIPFVLEKSTAFLACGGSGAGYNQLDRNQSPHASKTVSQRVNP
jgi:hypothetical protein